jgi:hypothetical protein
MPHMVMVRCPGADKAVAAGLRCEISDFGVLSARAELDCPACGEKNRWPVRDAWLRDSAYATGELRLGPLLEQFPT